MNKHELAISILKEALNKETDPVKIKQLEHSIKILEIKDLMNSMDLIKEY